VKEATTSSLNEVCISSRGNSSRKVEPKKAGGGHNHNSLAFGLRGFFLREKDEISLKTGNRRVVRYVLRNVYFSLLQCGMK